MQTNPILYTIQPHDSLYKIAQKYNTTPEQILALNKGLNLYNLPVGHSIYIHPGHATNKISRNELNLSNEMRSLWEQHVEWTRFTILSMIFNLPDVDLTTMRLLRNPIDFKNLLTPLYGEANATKLADLLKDHLLIASQVVTNAKNGNTKGVADAERAWYLNASEIATFLARINPLISANDFKKMLDEHLALTKAEAVYLLNKDYASSISTYDKIEKQALGMADYLTSSIVKQFPNRFI